MSDKAAITVGVYQPKARNEEPARRLERLARVLDDPAARQCSLLVCPELFLSGYFVDDKLHERAETPSGSFAREACRLAREHRCAIVYGYPERDGDHVYNAALCAGPDGRVAANHRKNLLPGDYEQHYFQPGWQPTTLALQGWKIGMLVCYEAEFPEPARHYARAGCDLVVASTALVADWPVVAQRVIPARAFENNLFLAYANHAGTEGDHRFLGESVVVSPFGRDLARAGTDEALVTARLDPAEMTRARERLQFLENLEQSCYR